jgi:hypothetical protein
MVLPFFIPYRIVLVNIKERISMKNYKHIFLYLIILLLLPNLSPAWQGKVVNVSDGDTNYRYAQWQG